MRPGHFFSELQRRHVLRVIGAYAFAAWIAVEVYTTIQPILFETAEWSNRLVVIMALAGFPVAFVLAWVFDITPQGLYRTAPRPDPQEPDAGSADTPPAGRRVLSPRATGFFGLGILLALVGFAAYAGIEAGSRPTAAAVDASAIRSIAVLPFTGTGGDGEPDVLGDGIAEELLNRLTRLPDLKVPARTSSFAFRGTQEDVREIGRELGVQAVLEGSVRRSGDEVRVNVRLIDAGTGYQIWSESFRSDATDVFALQDQISEAIIDRLKLRFAAAPEAGERGTTNPRAHELYLLGLQRWHQRTDRDLRQALGHFTNAVAEDPQFALAHAALAQTYAVLPAYGAFPVDTAIMRGSAAAAQAVALDASLSEAYAAMGQIVQNFEWDFDAAEHYYGRALEYSNSVTAHQWYAEVLMLQGRYDQAAEHVESVLSRDALSPIGLYIASFLATVRGSAAGALPQWRELTRLHHDFELGWLGYVYTAIAAGRRAEAAEALGEVAVLMPRRAALYQAIAAGVADDGDRAAALAAVRADAGLSASERVAWQVALGERAGALDTLEAAYERRMDVYLPFLLAHPVLRPLRSDARFRRMIDEVGIRAGG
jgi:TolB-like protein/tetratricopeptide (TPR) repeat protein